MHDNSIVESRSKHKQRIIIKIGTFRWENVTEKLNVSEPAQTDTIKFIAFPSRSHESFKLIWSFHVAVVEG